MQWWSDDAEDTFFLRRVGQDSDQLYVVEFAVVKY